YAHALQLCSHRLRRLSRIGIALVHRCVDGRARFDGPHAWIGWREPPRTTRPKDRFGQLRLEDGARGRLVGDQPVEEPTLERSPDGRNLGATDRRPDGQGLGRYLRGNAGEAK